MSCQHLLALNSLRLSQILFDVTLVDVMLRFAWCDALAIHLFANSLVGVLAVSYLFQVAQRNKPCQFVAILVYFNGKMILIRSYFTIRPINTMILS